LFAKLFVVREKSAGPAASSGEASFYNLPSPTAFSVAAPFEALWALIPFFFSIFFSFAAI
jgi:hypothetical protein